MFRVLSFASFAMKRVARQFMFMPMRQIKHNVPRLKTAPKVQEFEPPRIDPSLFESRTHILLGQLDKAFTELKESEPRIKRVNISSSTETGLVSLEVDIDGIGLYSFRFSNKEQLLYFTSPLSGVVKYFFESTNEHWISNRDRHIMEDYLVREVTKHCKGYLNL